MLSRAWFTCHHVSVCMNGKMTYIHDREKFQQSVTIGTVVELLILDRITFPGKKERNRLKHRSIWRKGKSSLCSWCPWGLRRTKKICIDCNQWYCSTTMKRKQKRASITHSTDWEVIISDWKWLAICLLFFPSFEQQVATCVSTGKYTARMLLLAVTISLRQPLYHHEGQLSLMLG